MCCGGASARNCFSSLPVRESYTASASFQFGGTEYYRKAQAAFEHAIALKSDGIDARVYMANMFTDTGRVEKAVPLLREALKTNPNHAEIHWELGYAYPSRACCGSL